MAARSLILEIRSACGGTQGVSNRCRGRAGWAGGVGVVYEEGLTRGVHSHVELTPTMLSPGRGLWAGRVRGINVGGMKEVIVKADGRHVGQS